MKKLVKKLVPIFDEVALFVIGLSFLVLLAVDNELSHQVLSLISVGNLKLILLLLLCLLGMLLAIFHVFSHREKSDFEKQAMITFGITANVIASFFAGSFGFASSKGLMSLPPLLSVLNACVLLTFCAMGLINGSNISDRNADSLVEIGFSAASVITIIAVTSITLGLHWSESYSICIIYVTYLNKVVTEMVFTGTSIS